MKRQPMIYSIICCFVQLLGPSHSFSTMIPTTTISMDRSYCFGTSSTNILFSSLGEPQEQQQQQDEEEQQPTSTTTDVYEIDNDDAGDQPAMEIPQSYEAAPMERVSKKRTTTTTTTDEKSNEIDNDPGDQPTMEIPLPYESAPMERVPKKRTGPRVVVPDEVVSVTPSIPLAKTTTTTRDPEGGDVADRYVEPEDPPRIDDPEESFLQPSSLSTTRELAKELRKMNDVEEVPPVGGAAAEVRTSPSTRTPSNQLGARQLAVELRKHNIVEPRAFPVQTRDLANELVEPTTEEEEALSMFDIQPPKTSWPKRNPFYDGGNFGNKRR